MGMTEGSLIAAFRGAYRYLSNFYVEKDGLTLEHRFQAAKATNQIDQNYVLNAPLANEAKVRGHEISLRPDWEGVKDQVMLDLVRTKFAPGSKLADWLLATHPAELVEGNTWGDTYWGASLYSGKGQNRLGKILMQVRQELVETERADELQATSEAEDGDW